MTLKIRTMRQIWDVALHWFSYQVRISAKPALVNEKIFLAFHHRKGAESAANAADGGYHRRPGRAELAHSAEEQKMRLFK